LHILFVSMLLSSFALPPIFFITAFLMFVHIYTECAFATITL
jgi:hypothetical protein